MSITSEDGCERVERGRERESSKGRERGRRKSRRKRRRRPVDGTGGCGKAGDVRKIERIQITGCVEGGMAKEGLWRGRR